MESLAGAARNSEVIMNGWYSASQEIVFGTGARGANGGFFRQSASSGNL